MTRTATDKLHKNARIIIIIINTPVLSLP